MAESDLCIGFDLSTQQLKALVVDSNLVLQHEAKVHFDDDLGHYGIAKGVITNPSEGEIFAPVAMWLEAIELVLSRLRDQGCQFDRIKALSGAGMQHGTVFWSLEAEQQLLSLNHEKTLREQLEPSTEVHDRRGAFSHPHSPNWQDASTQKQCDAFDRALGSPEELANVTGSKAHHRFSGPQIMRWSQKYPEEWKKTSRITLVSSFISSIFLGKIAPIDISDVGGMNLWDIANAKWHDGLFELVAGKAHVKDLKAKLGDVEQDGGANLGPISPYFVQRFGFPSDCFIAPCTGDNPSTILALPLRPSDAMVSLGTSTTFLMSTNTYKPDPAYHFMPHPTTNGLYMFMLCYKNGGLARELVRDAHPSKSWDTFDAAALDSPPLARSSPSDPIKLGLFFPRPEIVPAVHAGQWRYSYDPSINKLQSLPTDATDADPRLIIESQMLSLRLRSQNLVQPLPHPKTGKELPAQPRRVYLVGGASSNPAIARIAGDVLGGAEGVYKLDIGGNACALGAAYKAAWAQGRSLGETFEDFIGARWDEDKFVQRIGEGYREGTFELYGEALKGFEMMENEVVKKSSEDDVLTGGRFHDDKDGRQD